MKNIKLLLLFAASLFIFTACGQKPVSDVTAPDSTVTTNTEDVEKAVKEDEDVTTFKLTGENFKFVLDGTERPDLRVKQGDRVRIELTSKEGMHDWVVDEFNASTKQIQTGDSAFVEFVADKTGMFEYYCSVGQHRANGMRGYLIVE